VNCYACEHCNKTLRLDGEETEVECPYFIIVFFTCPTCDRRYSLCAEIRDWHHLTETER
jgi:hypothetical protein